MTTNLFPIGKTLLERRFLRKYPAFDKKCPMIYERSNPCGKQDFTLSLFDDRDMAEISSPDCPGERLMVFRNPLLAEDRRRTREELLKAPEQVLALITKAMRRNKDALREKKDE